MHQALKIFLCTTLAYMNSCYALPSDRHEKLEIQADKSTYNYKTGINIFIGHVKAKQGTSHLHADKLITKSNKQHQIYEVTAFGYKNKAHYWSQPKPNDAIMHGWAKKMKYYPKQGNLTLYSKALVTQKQNSFHGDLIHYNSIDQVITVPGQNNNRSVLVYNPED